MWAKDEYKGVLNRGNVNVTRSGKYIHLVLFLVLFVLALCTRVNVITTHVHLRDEESS